MLKSTRLWYVVYFGGQAPNAESSPRKKPLSELRIADDSTHFLLLETADSYVEVCVFQISPDNSP
jgi:hypothetical protein